MHCQSPVVRIGRSVPKESDDLVILGVTFVCETVGHDV